MGIIFWTITLHKTEKYARSWCYYNLWGNDKKEEIETPPVEEVEDCLENKTLTT